MKRTIICLLSAFVALVANAQTPITLTLQECRDRAIRFNEELTIADNHTAQARLDRELAFINYLPKVDAQAMTGWRKDQETMGMTVQMRGFYLANITIQQPLYAGGRIKAGNELAKIGQKVSEEQLRLKQQEVLLETDQAYWGYVNVLQKVKMLETYREYMQALSQQVKVSVDAGYATGNELLRINAKTSEIEYNLQKARTGAELCRLVLCNAIGCDFDTQVIPADEQVPVEKPGMMDEDLSERPELQLLSSAVEARKKQVKLTLGEYLPSLGLGLSYTWYGGIKMKGYTEYEGSMVPYTQNLKDHTPMAMASLSIPLWNWGESWKKVRKARLDVDNSIQELEHNRRLLSIQARQAILNVSDGYMQIETAQKGVEQATENLRVMREKYDSGFATLTDLLDAQSLWQQSESNLIEAKTQYRIYQSEYLKAVGRL